MTNASGACELALMTFHHSEDEKDRWVNEVKTLRRPSASCHWIGIVAYKNRSSLCL